MKRSALLLLVAPLVLAACGGSSNAQVKVDPVAYVRHAARVTAATPSEHMKMTAKMNGRPMTMAMVGSGDYSNTTHTGSFTIGAFRVVLAGTAIYMSSPLMAQDLPAGKTWVKIDLAAAARANGGVDISSLISRSPTQALQQLEAAGAVTQVGTQTLDGVATTHYRVKNLDLSKLPQGAKLETLGHVKYGPIDVWIGNADRYVYRESMSFTVEASGQSTSMTMRVDFSKFGEKVNVTVPSASKTTDASVLPGFGG